MILSLIWAFVLWSLFQTCCFAASSYFPLTQFYALEVIYNSLQGKGWDWRPTETGNGVEWNFKSTNVNPCRPLWQGLNCSDSCFSNVPAIEKTCSVTALELSQYNLTGTIPSAIGNLTGLIDLDFSSNHISGSIPTAIGLLTNLQTFNLGALVSPVFDSLVLSGDYFATGLNISQVEKTLHNTRRRLVGGSNTTSIYDILGTNYTFHNKLTGTLPSELGQLKSLEFIDFSHNRFSGTIPRSFYQLSNLTFLNFDYNILIDAIPRDVGQLKKIQTFSILLNYIEGSIPTEFGLISTLQFLGLSANRVEGSIPSELGACVNLGALLLESNNMVGTLPESLGNLTAMTYFTIGINYFTGTIPSVLGNMANVSVFGLEDNKLSGTIPPSICSFKNVAIFLIDFNLLTGPICSNFNELENVKLFVATDNLLSQSIPDTIFAPSYLVNFDWSYNRLTGALPPTIGSTPLLSNCSARLNADVHVGFLFTNSGNGIALDISNTIDAELDKFLDSASLFNIVSAASFVSFSTNFLSHSIPSEVAKLSCLSYLLLYSNLLSGSIPTEIGAAIALTAFVIDSNSLTGTIPDSIAQLTQLKQITFNNNKLSGTLPANITKLTRLVSVTAESNRLTGTIPEDFFSSVQVETFSLFSNYLSGTIPSSVTRASSLRSLLLSNNHLKGNLHLFNDFVPVVDGGALSQLQSLDFSNNELTGTLPAELFLLPNVTSLSLVKNCFVGSIPETICEMKAISSLNLNGLAAGDACEIPLIQVLRTYTTKFMASTVPTCLFSLSTLHSLDISGNGLRGSLPDVEYLPSTLVNISASHNRITGTIPSAFGAGNLSVLDMRSNELSGTIRVLSSFFSAYVSNVPTTPGSERNNSRINITVSVNDVPQLALSENRLSGNVPASFRSVNNINILSGNLFGCNSKSELPLNDPSYQEIGCGTNFLEATLGMYFFFLLAIVFIGCILMLCRNRMRARIAKKSADGVAMTDFIASKPSADMTDTESADENAAVVLQGIQKGLSQLCGATYGNNVPETEDLAVNSIQKQASDVAAWQDIDANVTSFVKSRMREVGIAEDSYCFNLLSGLKMVSVLSCALLVLVWLPFYPILKNVRGQAYSTHTYQYALGPSTAYLSGRLPAMCVCFLILVVATSMYVGLSIFNRTLRQSLDKLIDQSKTLSWDAIRNVYTGGTDLMIASDLHPELQARAARQMSAVGQQNSNIRRLSSKAQLAAILSIQHEQQQLPHQQQQQELAPQRSLSCAQSLKGWYLLLLSYSTAVRNILFIIADILLISLINGAFVYVILTQNESAVYVAEFALAGTKIGWNSVVLPAMLKRINTFGEKYQLDSSAPGAGGPDAASISIWNKRSTRLDVQIYLTIFNMLISPILCLLVDGSNCFLHTFVQNETIEVTTVYRSCHVTDFTGQCVDIPSFIQTIFVPPFIYTYQCSSQFIRSYVPVFVIMYIFMGLLAPLGYVYLAFVSVRVHPPQRTDLIDPMDMEPLIDRLFHAYWSKDYLNKRAAPIFGSKSVANDGRGENGMVGKSRSSFWSRLYGRFFDRTTFERNCFDALSKRAAQVDKYICRVVVDISILLTFGVAYPALGVIVCVSILLSCLEFKLLISRCAFVYDHMSAYREQNTRFPPLKGDGVIDILHRFKWVIVCAMCWFFAFVVYDISLGSYGSGSWASVVLVAWPFVLVLVEFCGGRKMWTNLWPSHSNMQEEQEWSSPKFSSRSLSTSVSSPFHIFSIMNGPFNASTRAVRKSPSVVSGNASSRAVSQESNSSNHLSFELPRMSSARSLTAHSINNTASSIRFSHHTRPTLASAADGTTLRTSTTIRESIELDAEFNSGFGNDTNPEENAPPSVVVVMNPLMMNKSNQQA